MTKQRIKLEDNTFDIVTKMCEGNPGAMNVIMDLLKINHIKTILMLDSIGIYGTDIYVLYNDICDNDIVKFIGVIDAVQYNLFNENTLKDAAHRQDRSGRELVPVDDLCDKVNNL